MKIAGSIIAGGMASRMGYREKPLLPLGTGTLLDVLLRTVEPQVDALALDIRRDSRPLYESFAERGVVLISDPFTGTIGPLGGIVGALNWLQTLQPEYKWLATFPGDCPFLPGNLVATLRAGLLRGQAWPVVVFDGERVQSLCALWPRRILGRVKEIVDQGGPRSMRSLLGILGAVQCEIRGDFLNVNTESDLATAERRLLEHQQLAAVS